MDSGPRAAGMVSVPLLVKDRIAVLSRPNRSAPFKHVSPKCGHAAVGCVIRRLKWHIDVTSRLQEQRHLGDRCANGQMLDIHLDVVAGSIAGNCQRLICWEVISLTGHFQPLANDSMHSLWIVAAGRK